MTIGCYETVRLLGKGGMSEVYEAVNASSRACRIRGSSR